MLNANNKNESRFSHDCECCAFVGAIGWGKEVDADVWVCLHHKELIVRYSSRADHYSARPLSQLRMPNEGDNFWIPASHAFMFWKERIAAL